MKSSSDRATYYHCPVCQKETLIHKNYVAAGINCCVGGDRCLPIRDSIPSLLQVRGWTFISYTPAPKVRSPPICFSKVGVTDHQCTISFVILKGGGDCRICINQSKTTNPVKREKIPRPDCNCVKEGKGLQKGKGYGKLCIHYNHAACCPDSALDWDYEANDPVRPELISVNSHTLYWWRCRNDWCQMPYQQSPKSRGLQKQRCPYCGYDKVCNWNCLATTHPELISQWDPSNTITPYEVSYGSHIKVSWICTLKTGEIHRWSATIYDRALGGTGCAACNKKGFRQEHGGHEVFVEMAMAVHGGKYSYPDPYKGNHAPIDIECHTVDSISGEAHGLFKQTPGNHKAGNGCPKCARNSSSSKGIVRVEEVLTAIGYQKFVSYLPEKSYPDLRETFPLRFDIYLPTENLLIEYDGEQHFKIMSNWGGIEAFNDLRRRDLRKDLYCFNNKINLVRIPYGAKDRNDLYGFLVSIIQYCRQGWQVHMSYLEFHQECGIVSGSKIYAPHIFGVVKAVV